jgi:hypothetical protein
MPDVEMPFSLDWLHGAATKPPEVLTVCDAGHLVVHGRTHYQPTRFSSDLGAIWCRWVHHGEEDQ